jgi:hypothetical protein
MGAIVGLFLDGLAWMGVQLVGLSAETLSKDYRDDPDYKRNLQKLIEHHRQFEKRQ